MYAFQVGDRHFTFRPARPEEAPAVLETLIPIARWIRETGSPQWGHYLEYPREELVAGLAAEADRGELYVVTEGERIAAVVTLQGAQTDWDRTLWGTDSGDATYLHRLGVAREYSGLGLGLQVLDLAIQRSQEQGKRYLRLDCVAWVEALDRLYSQRLSFMGEQVHYNLRFKTFERVLASA